MSCSREITYLLLDVYVLFVCFSISYPKEFEKSSRWCLKGYENAFFIYTSKGDLYEFYVNYGTPHMATFQNKLSGLPEIYYQKRGSIQTRDKTQHSGWWDSVGV